MAFSAEVHHVKEPLLSSKQENYDTLNVQGDHDSEVAIRIRTETIGEDQPGQEVLSGPASERMILPEVPLNEPRNENHKNHRQRSKCSRLLSLLNSTKPLKYLAIAFGLWSELGRWSLGLIVTISVFLLSADMFGLSLLDIGGSCYCNSTDQIYNNRTWENCNCRLDTDKWVMVILEAPSHSVMVYCIRRSNKRTKVLQLPKAFELVKNSKRVNLLLLVSLIMITLSTSLRKYFYFMPLENLYPKLLVVCLICFSVITWLTIVNCFVFGTVMKALEALVDRCLDRIITVQADSVNYYIDVHQDLFRTIESTFNNYKKWFLVNTFAYTVLLLWIIIGMFSLTATFFGETFKEHVSDHTSFSQAISNFFYFSTLLLYAAFACYYPWSSLASLKSSLNLLIQTLNTKTDWPPGHPFNSRSQLNDFVHYAKNTECRPFMKFTCSAKIPYISICLAICGLALTLYSRYYQETKNMLHAG